MVFTEYFNLWNIFGNELIGDITLFILLAFGVIFYLSIYYKMPKELTVMFGLFFSLIAFSETGIESILVYVVLIIGLIYYYIINKKVK